MKKALLIHGWFPKKTFYDGNYPTASNSHWFPWLSKQLMIRDIHAVAIEMPESYYPDYEIWKKELERFEIDKNTILVGHSCGGGFLVRWLSEKSGIKVDQVILVAPWLGVSSNGDKPFNKNFFDFTIDNDLAKKANRFVILNSSNDDKDIHESVDILRQKVDGLKCIELKNKGHFTKKSLGGEEFPELLNEIMDETGGDDD